MSESLESPAAERAMFRPTEFSRGSEDWLSRTVKQLSGLIHPLLATIPTVTVTDVPGEEDVASSDDLADAELKSPLYRGAVISHEWIAHLDECLTFDVDALHAQLYELADSYGSQMMKGLIELINDTCEENDQVVDAKGKDFFEAMIEAAEKVEFSFDADGNHNFTVLLHPDMADKLRGKRPTAEQEARMAAVMARKRSDWNAARSRRDLPGLPDGT